MCILGFTVISQENTRTLEKALELIFPLHFQENMTMPTPWFQVSGLRNCKVINICCSKPHSLQYFGTEAQLTQQEMEQQVQQDKINYGTRSLTFSSK